MQNRAPTHTVKSTIKWSHTNNMEAPGGFAIIEAHQWRVFNQQGTELSKYRLSTFGKYQSTTWMDAVDDVIAAFLKVSDQISWFCYLWSV